MSARWTPPTICRRCNGVINAMAHTLSDCQRQQMDAAMLADKQRQGYQQRAQALANKDQLKLMDTGVLA